ncbi:MAG: hypothetical protein AAF802_12900 [Planctomycetota bacterium]
MNGHIDLIGEGSKGRAEIANPIVVGVGQVGRRVASRLSPSSDMIVFSGPKARTAIRAALSGNRESRRTEYPEIVFAGTPKSILREGARVIHLVKHVSDGLSPVVTTLEIAIGRVPVEKYPFDCGRTILARRYRHAILRTAELVDLAAEIIRSRAFVPSSRAVLQHMQSKKASLGYSAKWAPIPSTNRFVSACISRHCRLAMRRSNEEPQRHVCQLANRLEANPSRKTLMAFVRECCSSFCDLPNLRNQLIGALNRQIDPEDGSLATLLRKTVERLDYFTDTIKTMDADDEDIFERAFQFEFPKALDDGWFEGSGFSSDREFESLVNAALEKHWQRFTETLKMSDVHGMIQKCTFELSDRLISLWAHFVAENRLIRDEPERLQWASWPTLGNEPQLASQSITTPLWNVTLRWIDEPIRLPDQRADADRLDSLSPDDDSRVNSEG